MSMLGTQLLALAAVLSARHAAGQEALRNSLAGDAAIEARRQQAGAQAYTVKSGDFRLLATPSLGLDWNDSVNTSKANSEQDFILKPMLQLNASYPLTQHNLLKVNVGIGYDHYLQHDEYSGLRLQSGSEISLDAYVKDFWFNLHDRFQYSQDSAGQAAVANTARYGGFDNTAGLTTTWDLKDLVLTLGYDHQNFISSAGEFDYLDRASESVLVRAGFRLHPRLTAGLEGTASFTAYDHKVLNDNTAYSGGLYADWRPGSYFKVQPRVGYVFYDFQQTSAFLRAVNQDGWYAGLSLTHNVSDAVSYSLDVGHELRLGQQADLIEDSYLRPSVTWKIIKDWTFTTFLSYEHGIQGAGDRVTGSTGNVAAGISETYDWFGGGLSLSHPITKKLDLSLNYRLTLRSSDAASRDYTQNLVGLLLTYKFQ